MRGSAGFFPVDWRVFALVFPVLLAGLLCISIYVPVPPRSLNRLPVRRIAAMVRLAPAPATVTAHLARLHAQTLPVDSPETLAIKANDLGQVALADVALMAADTRPAWQRYAGPFNPHDPRPRLAVVVGELGMEEGLSEKAVQSLPGSVTLAFSSLAPEVHRWLVKARGAGHETVLALPMEPLDYPTSDPGENSLLVKNTATTNLERLKTHLDTAQGDKGGGFIGITTFSGSRLATTPSAMLPILAGLKANGWLWLDARLSPLTASLATAQQAGIPAIRADFTLAEDTSSPAIEATLHAAEHAAKQNGFAVLVVAASPRSINRLQDWLATLPGKAIALAPLSAMPPLAGITTGNPVEKPVDNMGRTP